MSIQVIQQYLISEYRVMRSAAGHYVGSACFDPAMPEAGCNIPYSRDSGYMSKADAERLLSSFIFSEECDSPLEQDAVAEYRMAMKEEVGLERAIYDALWVMDSESDLDAKFEAWEQTDEAKQLRNPGRIDIDAQSKWLDRLESGRVTEPTVAMPAEQQPYQFELEF